MKQLLKLYETKTLTIKEQKRITGGVCYCSGIGVIFSSGPHCLCE